MSRIGRIFHFFRPYIPAFVASFVLAVLASIFDGFSFALMIPFLRVLFGGGPMQLEAPTVVERVLDTTVGGVLSDEGGFAALRAIALLILAAVALKNVAGYVAAYLGAYIQEGFARDLRNALYAHIQQLGLGFYQRTRGGQLISRMLADADQAKVLVSAALASVLQNGVLIAVYVAILFALSWRLTLLTLILAPLLALVLTPVLRRMRQRLRRALDDRGELTVIMSDTVGGVRLVKAHAAESYERRRFSEAANRYFDGILRTQRLAILASPLSETLASAVVVMLLLSVTLIAAEAQTFRPELFVTFLAVTIRLLPPVKSLAQFPAYAQQAMAAADRVFEILEEPPDDIDDPSAIAFPRLQREIRFSDVWFAYEPDNWVLRGIQLAARRGEVVAIVGPSGAGKSTLVDMLPRFIQPQRGVILIDGVPINVYTRRSLRSSLGIVSQEMVIFNETVLANIAYGDQSGVSQEAIEAAARAANAHSFIEHLPQGYATLLGERGTRLSGGERQRIALARVLLRDPPILILDEATSALDTESERLVQEAIGRLLENRTVFVIAHRLSTVARADLIVVLDGGRIVEQGRHSQLVSGGGLYQRLHALQLAGAEE